MFRIKKWIAGVLLFLPAVGFSSPEGNSLKIDPKVTVGLFAAVVEDYLAGVLRTARVIALTKEAQSAKWEEIKPLLDRLSQDLVTDAACWFALPDGSYYSSETGKLTDQNLKDRSYFPKLMGGSDVVGELVVSKSTGHRSVIVAIPVMKDGKIVGGIGVSVRARLLSELVEKSSKLPENTYFYALDKNAKIALHRFADRMFKKVSEVGNAQLEAEFKQQFRKDQGTFEYTLNKKRIGTLFKKSESLGWYFFIAQEIQ